MAKKKPPNAVERRHIAQVVSSGCIICESPAEYHHLLTGAGMGQRAGHMHGIALCARHHRHGNYGVAIHAGIKGFEANFGTELELLEKTKERLDRCVF